MSSSIFSGIMENNLSLGRHVIINVQTLSPRANAAVIALGAVALDHRLRTVATLHQSIAHGAQPQRSRCTQKVDWWRTQSHAVRRSSLDAISQIAPLRALQTFVMFVGQHSDTKDVRIWGSSHRNDCAVLADLFADFQVNLPWVKPNERCLTTFLELYPKACDVGPFEGVQHHALDDATHEAKQLAKALDLHEAHSHMMQALERVNKVTSVSGAFMTDGVMTSRRRGYQFQY